MKTPITPQKQNFSEAEELHSHYNSGKGDVTKELEKPRSSGLLTPFLLSIPVIVMLIILISQSFSDPSTTAAEPQQYEATSVQTGKAVALP